MGTQVTEKGISFPQLSDLLKFSGWNLLLVDNPWSILFVVIFLSQIGEQPRSCAAAISRRDSDMRELKRVDASYTEIAPFFVVVTSYFHEISFTLHENRRQREGGGCVPVPPPPPT